MKSKTDTYTRYPGETLCWSCTKSDCSWFTNFIPVDGWKANKTEYKSAIGIVDSYTVKKCPLYKEFKRKTV